MSVYSREAEARHTELVEAYLEGYADGIGRPLELMWDHRILRAGDMCRQWMKDHHHVLIDVKTVLFIWEQYWGQRRKR